MKILCLSLVISILSFSRESNGIEITCEYFPVDYSYLAPSFEDREKFSLCSIKAIDFEACSPDKIDSVVNFSDPPKTEVNFVRFSSVNCPTFNVTSIPKGLSEVFPNLVGLWLAVCDIETLNADDLCEYSNLEILGIVGSSFSEIPAGFFDPVPNLIYLNMNGNQIQKVEHNLLTGFNKLEKAYFSGNVCIKRNALDESEVPALNEELNENCTQHCEESPNSPSPSYDSNYASTYAKTNGAKLISTSDSSTKVISSDSSGGIISTSDSSTVFGSYGSKIIIT